MVSNHFKAPSRYRQKYYDCNVSIIGISDLDILWNLGIGYWDLGFYFIYATLIVSKLEYQLSVN